MNRVLYWFKQIIGQADLNALQDRIEGGDHNIAMDIMGPGIVSGLSCVPNNPQNFSVQILNGIAYDNYGQRINIPGNQTTDCSANQVTTAGQECWISLVATFARNNYNSIQDGNGVTLNYNSDEFYTLSILAGALANTGSATRPVIPVGNVLLGDVHLYAGQTGIGSADIDLSRCKYVINSNDKAIISKALLKDGSIPMTGPLTLSADPTSPLQAATKEYVDNYVQGLSVKESCRAATTGTNISLSGAQTIDGVTLNNNDRILVKDQTNASQNGIYLYNPTGAYTRAIDASTSTDFTNSIYTFIEEGTINASSGWVLNISVESGVVLGTTNLTFTQFSGAGEINAGNNLTKSGNILSLSNTINAMGPVNETQATNIASGATTNIGGANGNFIQITGNTAITSFGTAPAGAERTLEFMGSLTITYNAISLILPGGTNLVTNAGDILKFRSLGSGNWICVGYEPAQSYSFQNQRIINLAPGVNPTDARTAGQRSNRNVIINGGMNVWQRAIAQGITSLTVTSSGIFLADHWEHLIAGSSDTASQQSFTLGQGVVPYEPAYWLRDTVTSVAGAGNFALREQKIEDVRTLAGQTVTLSFWAKADAAKNIAVEFVQSFGTGGSPSSIVTGIGSQLIALTTNWQYYTITIAIPSISGKTIGTNLNSSNLILYFWFDAGANYATRAAGLGQQSGVFDITQIQLEQGSAATNYELRSYAQELALCQRYLEINGYNFSSTGAVFGSGFFNTSTNFIAQIPFAVPKRTNAYILVSSAISGSNFSINGSYNVSAMSLSGAAAPSIYNANVSCTNTTATIGQGGQLQTIGANFYLGFDAEIY